MATTAVRLYLTGRLHVSGPTGHLSQDQLPGRQGRRALAYLALSRSQPTARDALADVLWPDEPPTALDAALSAIVSKIRSGLARTGLDGALHSAAGCYELRLPPGAWLDAEVAATELDRAEGARRQGDVDRWWAGATVANAILRRPFLPGDESEWARWQRTALLHKRLRAADCLAEAWLHRGEGGLAQQVTEEALAVAPLREEGYRLLMRAHLAQGNRSDALVTFHRCREVLGDELGVDPAPETEAVYQEALRRGNAR